MDVVEVDAASHNGVDDVREIRERVAHLPAQSRFKVYILDEAHMFSTAAWNAFLKTLEEPPAHARFVFATTEPEKVPETIVSRCQRFDFRRIHSADIVRTLASILEKENVGRSKPLRASTAALETIARFARGGLRDAESLLEQALLAGEGEVREEDLAALLGTVPRERVREVLERAFEGDGAGTLRCAAAIHAGGADAATFLGQALELLRECLVLAVAGPTSTLVDTGDGERAALAALSQIAGRAGLLRAVQILAETMRLVRATDEERPLVEAGLLRIALGAEVRTAGEVLDVLRSLEARLAGGAPPDPPRAAPLRPSGAAPAVATGPSAARVPEPSVAWAEEAPPPRPVAAPALFQADDPVSDPEAEPVAPSSESLADLWPKVVETAKAEIGMLGTFLAPARPRAGTTPGRVTLEFPAGNAFHRSQCEDPGRKSVIEGALRVVTGTAYRVDFATAVEDATPAEQRTGATAAAPDVSFDRVRHDEVERLMETPLLKAMAREFKVKMIKVERLAADVTAARPAEDAGNGNEEEIE
jgi:DNA polymerase-3 subunit gamma/tau